MRYLFFFVHPSKFYVFRNTINSLKAEGHNVDILITAKDVLEDLVRREGWPYTNIFPEGRKMKGVSPYISSGINFFRTLFRLWKYTRGKKYDLFITDDLLVYIGKLKGVPSMAFLDSDLQVVRQFALVLGMADYILAPDITDLGKYNRKKIGFKSYKELAYLHPNHFVPDRKIVEAFHSGPESYFLLRLVNLGAYHDVGMKGLTNENVKRLIALLETKGKVYISSERALPAEFEPYRLVVNPLHIAHVLYFAQLFIGDSQTMTSEAAVLGTPAFRCNDFVGKIAVMEEKEIKYGLSYNYPPARFEEMYQKIENLLLNADSKEWFALKRARMLEDKVDLSQWLFKFFSNFPASLRENTEKRHS